MGVVHQKGMPYAGSRPFDSPLRPGLQKGEQFIRWSKLSSAEAWRNNRLDGLQLLGRIGSMGASRRHGPGW